METLTKGLKKILDKLRGHFSDEIDKLENAEGYDGSHLCSHLEAKYPTTAAKESLCRKIEVLIPRKQNLQGEVPDAAKGDVIVSLPPFPLPN